MKTMHLLVTTPAAVVIDRDDVVSVRADDYSGSFGLLPGHCEFMTALPISVLSFRDAEGKTQHVAVRGGVLNMRGGALCEVGTREAVVDDDLARLHTAVLRQMVETADREAEARTQSLKHQLRVMSQINRYLRGERPSVTPHGHFVGGGGLSHG
ncbi:MAG: F0F1 ATP synthase subunit epsilon [Rhodospirillaceae bacterium]